ncbi:hypothetical protein C8R45DRAFT_386919 [Mycena sanguinolenta]|nr:hypothetical protein C8R45DRAFT_386919 [Mycena sanguinolenta]
MDQTINDLQTQLDEMRRMWTEESLLRQRAEQELKTLRRTLADQAEATNVNGGDDANDTHNPPSELEEISRPFRPLKHDLEYRLVGGIYISNEEGVRWFEQQYDSKLPQDHSGDASVCVNLEDILEDEGFLLGVEYIPCPGTTWWDFLALTQAEKRDWEYRGPEGLGEVTEPGRQLKGDTPREEEMRNLLRKLGFEAKEFKCYYLYHYVD